MYENFRYHFMRYAAPQRHHHCLKHHHDPDVPTCFSVIKRCAFQQQFLSQRCLLVLHNEADSPVVVENHLLRFVLGADFLTNISLATFLVVDAPSI